MRGQRTVRRRAALCCLLLALAVGCGKGKGTISGTVKYKGTPLTSGTIIFRGPDGYVDSTSISNQGEYTLANFPVGEAKITVATQLYEKETPGGTSKSKGKKKKVANVVEIPTKYSDPERSKLSYTVVDGPQQHNVDLD
jgi:hypothetical protein